jgi:CheY-like chemotaxis protein
MLRRMSVRVPVPKRFDVAKAAVVALDEIKLREQPPRVHADARDTAIGVADRARVDAGNVGRASPISVLCADDHAGFRDVLRELIALTPGFVLIGEASSGADAIALVSKLRPDVVLLDVHMPRMSGFEAAAKVLRDHSGPLIVLMSADPIELPAALSLRADDVVFVTKQELCPRRLLDLWHGRAPL